MIFISTTGDLGCLSLGISGPWGDNGYELFLCFGDKGSVSGRNEIGEGGTGDLLFCAGIIYISKFAGGSTSRVLTITVASTSLTTTLGASFLFLGFM